MFVKEFYDGMTHLNWESALVI